MRKSFTLIEILVVATIIGLLAAAAAISYSSLTKGSRDAKRKADLEQIRGALEMYRSNNAYNSYPASLTMTCGASGNIADGSYTYLSKIPTDPKCNAYTYYFWVGDAAGGSCNGAGTPCVKYTVGAYLENGSGSCTGSPACGSGIVCNYCLGQYGRL